MTMPLKEIAGPLPRRPAPQAVALVALAVALAVAVADALTPARFVLPVLSAVPLVICAGARSARLLWGLALLAVVLTFAFYLWGPPAATAREEEVAFVNRLLAAAVTLLVAGILHVWLITDRSLDVQRQALEKQNERLELANRELGQREEEIVRQNEELQSQTEELERQSEELRITNEDLAAREKTLEHLLELSRSLTAEFRHDEMLKKICESLGLLTDGNASAILEKQGDRLDLPCYHNFGPDGAAAEALPLAQSFAALIMSMGQTGYLEDVRLRPELVIPQPRHGEPFRAVLSSPLRVSGQCVGTVEIYSRTPQAWGEAQIAMLESLAAQASISLQSAELIEAIRQERRRFEAAFRTVPFGLAVAEDPEGRQVRVNAAAAAMLNVPLDENISLASVAGARLKRYIFQGDRPLPEDRLPLVRALRGEEIQGEEIDLVFPSGKRFALLVSAAPIYDGKGNVAGAVSAFADITTQKALQRELDIRRREAEEASVRKTRFLASVSHDIRTPVNAINLMAEVIRRAADNPAVASQIPHLVQRLQANALALVELVSDVLDISRFDSGKVDLQETEFSLGELLAEEGRQLSPLAQDKNLRLVVEPPERPLWLRTDRVKLARVIGNLVGNAIKFTEAGSVCLSAALTPDRHVQIRVSDTGPGIAAEHLPHIWDEFAQLRNPARDREKGTGLGLAISKRMVEVMGGSIEVESTVNVGSVFTVTLPPSCVVLRLDVTLRPGTADPPAERPAAGGALRGMRVLLVEDHTTTREGTAQILRDEGAVVLEATDGAMALQKIQDERFEVMLLDMMLPDLDGREILKRVGARRPAALKAVVVMSGDLTDERLEEVKRLGADAFVAKPIDVHKVIGVLRKLR
jgi:PAS domain S-box-containing protein